MRWIDLQNKRPTDSDIPGWTPWTQEQWDDWLATSTKLVQDLAALEAADKRDERNALIDANAEHWGKLKTWLLALSGGKCWFSDTRDLFSHYDVDHFRPKKEAKALDGSKRDGYWWLSFDYMNFRVCGNVANRKKGSFFPLRQNSLCSTFTARCEASETRYLLDPIDDDDVGLIAFDEEGNVVPMPGTSTWEQERVAETVKRLKLNEHAPLTEARRKILQKLNALVDEFNAVKVRCCTGNDPAAKGEIRQIRQQLRQMTAPSQNLSSVACWYIIVRNDPLLTRMLA